VSDVGLEHLRDSTNLEQLGLNQTQVSDAGLAALERMSKLTGLCLDATQVGDAGIEAVAHLPRLSEVSLANTRITDLSASIIARWNDLTQLDLSNTAITELGVKRLRGLKNLVHLELCSTRLSDAALQALANMNKLENLNLRDTPITDAALAYLKPLISLRRLYLSGTNVAGPGLENLLALPQLDFVELPRTNVSPYYLNVLRLRNALKEKTELDFQRQPLSDVIEYLKQRHDIEIHLHLKSLRDAGIGSDSAVTLKLKGVTLREGLEKILDPLKLTFGVHHEIVYIAAKTVADLMGDLPVVPAGQRLSPQLTETFMQPTELEFRQQPLNDVIAYLAKKHHVDLAIDSKSLTAAGIGLDVPVTCSMNHITLKSALELVLTQLDLVAEAEGEKVVIRRKPAE
ncbi:MAG: leucine-rich repeat domain-containing protein, partial [Pirellulales bacterium]